MENTTKIRVNMYDQFSMCTTSKEIDATKDQVFNLDKLQASGIPISQFDKKAQIHYNWVIEEIKYL